MMQLEVREDGMVCKHWDCPYKYCPYHEAYDETLEVVCEYVIPNKEYGDSPQDCCSYLDL